MSNLSRFLAKNKIKRENGKYAPSKAFVDENGNPLEFEFRPITSKRNEAIRESHTKEVPVTGKPNMFRPKLDTSAYINNLITESIVDPDLYNKELQDSYGVMSAEALIVEMVDNPEEFGELATFVQEYSGIDETLQEKVDEAKN